MLGINTRQMDGYNKKFGIVLNRQTAIPIDVTQNLEASDTNTLFDAERQQCSQELTEVFGADLEELDMLLFDAVPQDVDVNMEISKESIVVVQNSSGQPRKDELYGVVGACTPVYDIVVVGGGEEKDLAYLDPFGLAWIMFEYRGEYELLHSLEQNVDTTSSLELIEKHKHGTIVSREYIPYAYKASTGFVGMDRAVFLVEFGGYRVKVIYYLKVISEKVDLIVKQETDEKHCPRDHWEIWPGRQKSEGSQPDNSANWYPTPSLQSLLTGAKDALAGFADLPGASPVSSRLPSPVSRFLMI
jgi:hypothetical protein